MDLYLGAIQSITYSRRLRRDEVANKSECSGACACLLCNIAQHNSLVRFSALGSLRATLTAKLQFSGMQPCLFLASGATLYCFREEMYIP